MSIYSPRNRLPQKLPVLAIEVVHAKGTTKTDPNGMAIYSITGQIPDAAVMREMMQGGKLEKGRQVEPLQPLPNTASLLSGEPAVLYRTQDVEIALTPAELSRLAGLSLSKSEYFTLIRHFGMLHEWHEDFYDPETGEAVQPREDAQHPSPPVIGWQLINADGANCHGDGEPFGLASFEVLTGEAVEAARQWLQQNPGASLVLHPVFEGEVEAPNLVSAISAGPGTRLH